jgi:hypothetical protein
MANMKKDWEKTAGIIIGATLTLLIFFADQLGFDSNPVWGTRRYIMFFVGVAILFLSLLYSRDNFLGRVFATPDGQLYLGVTVLGTAIILYYVWCVTIGLWTEWPHEMNYYDLQATAFSHGQLALEVQPDPALLALGMNACEPENRRGISTLWDATFYEGKYYLYWGPVPALLLTVVKLFYTGEVGDNVVTFAFLSGTFLFMTMIILELWKRYFSRTPHWAILLAIAFAGLVNPMTYILFGPRVYEASIIAAQFFLIGGLYWLFSAFESPSILRFSLVGIFLACVVGSRTALLPPVALLAFIALVWAVWFHRANATKYITAIVLPLLIGAASYAWYNYARFGAITEFGLSYQLTAFNQLEDTTFSLAFVPFNTYKSLFNPFELRGRFPYFFPLRWMGPASMEESYPENYVLFAEHITGIFVGSPFVIFAFLAGLNKNRNFRWIVAALTGSTLLSFFTVQLFFFTSMRYLLDLVPTLALLAVIGFWQGLDLLERRTVARFCYITLGLLFAAYGFVASFALSIAANLEQFQVFNPQLLRQMTWIFNEILK